MRKRCSRRTCHGSWHATSPRPCRSSRSSLHSRQAEPARGGAADLRAGSDAAPVETPRAGGCDALTPSHRTHVWRWLKRPAQKLILPNWLAITLGRHIFSWRALDECELAHELCHVRQWKANGLRFVPRYLAASRTARLAGGNPYRDN